MITNEELMKNVENVAATLVATLKRKNADYGNSFSNLFERIGMPYAYGHLAEKLERIWSLMNNDAQVKNESLADSLYDLAGYAILTLAHIKEENAPEDKKTAKNERYFSDTNQPKFAEGDYVWRKGDTMPNEIFRVKAVTPAYILVTNNERDNLIYPYEQDLWEKAKD